MSEDRGRDGECCSWRRVVFSEPWQAGCTLLLVLSLGWYASGQLARAVDEDLRLHLLGQVSALARTIRPEDVAALSFADGDVDSPVFWRLREHLASYGRLLPESRWLYTMGRAGDGRIVFGPDNVSLDDPEGWDPPGSPYMRPPPGLLAVFSRRAESLIAGPYRDEFGEYVSAFSPVLDPRSGEVVMVVGIDVTAERWRERIRQARWAPVPAVLILLVALWAALRALAWRSRMSLSGQARLHHLEAVATLVFGLVLTVCVALWVQDAEVRRSRRGLGRLTVEVAEPVRTQFERISDHLGALARFAMLHPDLDQEQFQALAGPMVAGAPVIAYAWVSFDGHGDGAGTHVVSLVEPWSGNEPMVGFDLGAEPVRRAALEQAARTGLATGTAPLTLVHGDAGRRGILVFHPVFRDGVLLGLVQAVIRPPVLFGNAFSRKDIGVASGMRLRFYDVEGSDVAELLAEHPAPGGEGDDAGRISHDRLRLEQTYPVLAFGRTYAMVVTPTAGGAVWASPGLPWLVAVLGLVLTLAAAMFVGFLRERRFALEALVRQRAATLEERERQLTLAQRMETLGLMAGGIAHDFNNLLVAIQGNAELALIQVAQDEGSPLVKSLRAVITAARSGAGLTRQLLAYSGRGHGKKGPCDLACLLSDNAGMFRSLVGKGIRLEVAAGPEPAWIHGDPAQIQQVAMNLLTNAAEAIGKDKAGTIRLSVRVADCDAATLLRSRVDGHGEAGRYVWLEVTDTGCGMDAATCERMFEPFFTTKPSGHGLGTSAILGIVKRHGGAILVESESGRGTTIQVLFPALPHPPGDGALPLPSPREHDGMNGAAAGRGVATNVGLDGLVLVVDDEELFRSFCEESCRSFGYRVLAADGGRAAIRLCREHAGEIGCVILDMVMPDMDGAVVFDALREISPEVPVVICSGLSVEEARLRMGERRPAVFLHKPFGMNELCDALSSVLARKP